MKLKNKRTGEIVDSIQPLLGGEGYSIKELNEEWEDYEGPIGYWYVTEQGIPGRINFDWDTTGSIENHKEIGNYFETVEEAEQAVEKLKAWKRLKDKGFRFIDHLEKDCGKGICRYEWNGFIDGEDLDLLFSPEED